MVFRLTSISSNPREENIKYLTDVSPCSQMEDTPFPLLRQLKLELHMQRKRQKMESALKVPSSLPTETFFVNPNDNTCIAKWITDSSAKLFAVGLVGMSCGQSLSRKENVLKSTRVESESNELAGRLSRMFTPLTAQADEVPPRP